MEPVEWFAIASAVIGAASAASSADASADNSRSQAAIAQNQASVARLTADNDLAVGNANEEDQTRRSAYLLGQRRAAMLSSGVAADGSPLDAYGDLVGGEMLKALNARYDGQLKAWSALNGANLSDAQAGLDLAHADQAETAGQYGVASSLLKGAGNVNWAKLNTGTPSGSSGSVGAPVSPQILQPLTDYA